MHKYHQVYLFSNPNNHGIVLQHSGYLVEAKELISLLENHYPNPALTLVRDDVPEPYLSQFWTMYYWVRHKSNIRRYCSIKHQQRQTHGHPRASLQKGFKPSEAL